MVSPLVLARVVSLATSVRKRRRRKMDEFEIDWIPEDTGAPYEADECFNDIPAHTIDKIYCLKILLKSLHLRFLPILPRMKKQELLLLKLNKK